MLYLKPNPMTEYQLTSLLQMKERIIKKVERKQLPVQEAGDDAELVQRIARAYVGGVFSDLEKLAERNPTSTCFLDVAPGIFVEAVSSHSLGESITLARVPRTLPPGQ